MECKIYKLTAGDLIYIGSTKQKKLSKRFSNHKEHANDCKYTSHILFKSGIEVKINLIETCIEDDRYDRERYWIENTNCVNKVIPGREMKEWYQDNKENIKQYKKNNKEKILEYNKQYYQDNREQTLEKKKQKHECECGGRYISAHKLTHLKTQKHQNFIKSNTR